MHSLLRLSAFSGLILSGAIFGFFYAWVCSTMWGLDTADPKVAIAAMQAMNASVRNAVFAPAFFGTPLALFLTAVLAFKAGRRDAVWPFAAAGVIYLVGGMLLTMLVNVPMNEALALVQIPADPAEAARIWDDYSPRWQVWNQTRTLVSGITLCLAGYGMLRLGKSPGRVPA
ncbi:DUF1772 domain-containing protein [Denitrobaculum tricleocarpae]|uniref:DUF1772 domain-containing protein n=1 Tax=Denitrobaculum tricleocarpae TaxID=2591009 RepID=A0A545TKD8_9PROT|nr:anthrone oxygenase family protein [Denitrobaculum tricleocarpae]TQV77692.1 DUF1772 domain-containing protein [Denitrobaculum tricleocarpae]